MRTEFTLPTPTVLIQGNDSVFPVRRIYCVGRNYAAHVREMGFDPHREPPFFFCKPADAIVNVPANTTVEVPYPKQTSEYHHEVELVVAIGRAGSDIAVEDALDYVFGYAVGLDMTRRDLQLALRDKGRPWELGKAFDQSAPIAPLRRVSEVGHIDRGALWVQVNGEDRQRTDLAKLIWSVPEIIANLSTYFELQPGDLIFTGTPEGVGPVRRGDTMTGGITGLGELSVKVR